MRRLLDAVAADQRWRPYVKHIQVETWHPAKVAIYERLGFTVHRHGAAGGVECWTMLRPVQPAEDV